MNDRHDLLMIQSTPLYLTRPTHTDFPKLRAVLSFYEYLQCFGKISLGYIG